MKLTHDHVLLARTDAGAFTAASVEALGLDFQNLTKGWTRAIVGNDYTIDQIRAFINGRNNYAPSTIKRKHDNTRNTTIRN